jgi:hypothetical protein
MCVVSTSRADDRRVLYLRNLLRLNAPKNYNEVANMDKRTEYVQRLSAHMGEWDTQIDLIKARAIDVTPGTGSDFSTTISALQLKRDEVALKLHGISSAGDDEWEELKPGTEHALGEVRTMFHEAVTKIS